MVSMLDQNDEQILYATFNQDYGCFAIGTEIGFRVYNTHPFLEAFSRDLGGGIGIVEMLYRCNILALVGGGKNPKYPKNKVMLWDDHQTKIIGEMSFRSEVVAVRLRTNRVVVILENKIFVYNFSDLRLLDQIETYSNPRGLCTMNTEGEYSILACPDALLGHVFISHYGKIVLNKKFIVLLEQKKQIKIKAHQSTLSWIELNQKGNKIATSSEKGTVIRIYETNEGKMIQELRRGTEYAQIQSLSFDPTGRWIACSSDSGTIHIFCLKLNDLEKQELEKKEAESKDKKMEIKNPKSKFQFMKVMIPYLNQERSFSQFRIKDLYSKVAFGNDPCIIIVITTQGNYYLAQFDPINGGEAIQQMTQKMFAQTNTKSVNQLNPEIKKEEEKSK